MPRKAAAIVHVNLRIREDLRRRLETAAKQRAVSLNFEITSRIERSFAQESERTQDAISADMAINWARYSERFLALDLRDELVATAERTSAAIQQLTDTAKTRNLDAILAAVSAIDEANKRVGSVVTAIKHGERVKAAAGEGDP